MSGRSTRRFLRQGLPAVGLGALLIFGGCEPSGPPAPKSKESPAMTAKRNRLWAWRVTQGHVHRKLPNKTLKFPNEYWDAFVDERESDYYVITSYADTKDERDAAVRVHFECVLRRQDREWKLVSLNILSQEEI